MSQYDLKGNLIHTYDSIYNASFALNLNNTTPSHISECCMGKSKTAYGFVWRFIDEPFDMYNHRMRKSRFIDQYTKEGVYITTHNSLTDACRNIEVDTTLISSIYECCVGHARTSCGFVWRFNGESFDKYQVEPKKKQSKKVYQINNVSQCVKVYNSAKEAAEYLGVDKTTMYKVCKNHRYYKGFYWYFENDSLIDKL